MAIYTKFGTLFTLTTPVDWNTGWVSGRRDGNEEIKEYHVSDLRADGGLNEIQAASDALEPDALHLCHDCGLPMETLEQETREPQPITIVTCKNKACTLYSVTLSVEQYAALSPEQFQSYRTMVANLKKHMKGVDKS